jgi:hypothetical protein
VSTDLRQRDVLGGLTPNPRLGPQLEKTRSAKSSGLVGFSPPKYESLHPKARPVALVCARRTTVNEVVSTRSGIYTLFSLCILRELILALRKSAGRFCRVQGAISKCP